MTSPQLFVASGIFHPESGGPATYLHELLPILQRDKGWDIRLLTYGAGDPSAYPHHVQYIPRRAYPIRMAHYALSAYRYLQAADLVYAHTIDLPLYGRRVPRVIKIVGDQAWERCIRKQWIPPETDVDTFQKMRYSPLVERQKQSRSRQVRAFDGVIVPAQYLKHMVIGWGVPDENIHVIYNALPVDIENDVSLSRDELRNQWGWTQTPILLTAARLHPWKGVDALIAALHDIPDIRLVVAGDGDDLPRLQALAAPLGERVIFLGQVPRVTLYQMMRAADYFALYSGYEGLPHTVLESLRAGTPVIVSDKGGNPEVVQHRVNGYVVPYRDHAALVATLHKAFAPGKRERLAAHTQDQLSQFAFSTLVERTDAVLRQYLSTLR